MWVSVYKDYLSDHILKCKANDVPFNKYALPQELLLQNALRSALKDVKTAISDVVDQKATLQDDDLCRTLAVGTSTHQHSLVLEGGPPIYVGEKEERIKGRGTGRGREGRNVNAR